MIANCFEMVSLQKVLQRHALTLNVQQIHLVIKSYAFEV